MMYHNMYKKNFSSFKMEKTSIHEHPFSFVLPPLEFTALFFRDIMNNNYFSKNMEPYYLVGPLYGEGDFQICVTGTKYNCDMNAPISTMQREIEEEIGLDMKDTHDILSENKYTNGESSYCLSRIHIEDTNKITNGNRCTLKGTKIRKKTKMIDVVNHQKRMNKNKKIGCFIYGTIDDVKKIYNTGINLIYGENKDKIIGVVIISVVDAYKYFRSIVSSVMKIEPMFRYVDIIVDDIDDNKIHKHLKKIKVKNNS